MGRTLSEVVQLIERIAPPQLAEDWDNVGLLLEPTASAAHAISRVFLCIDLSEDVLDEALGVDAGLVVAYHPPLFRGLKRVRASATTAGERVVLRAIEARLPVYSPHTALDATTDGVNDWLGRAFGAARSRPIVANAASGGSEFKLVVFVPRSHLGTLRRALSVELGAGTIGKYSECGFELDGTGTFFGNESSAPVVGVRGQLESVSETRLEMRCGAAALKDLARVIAAHHPYEEPAWDLYPLARSAGDGDGDGDRALTGAGRLLELTTPISIGEACQRLKAHLGLPSLRVASAGTHAAGAPIARVAVCAGAGGSVFDKLAPGAADLFVTGELRHHDVLEKLRHGQSVLLSEHTHTERGYLPEFGRRLESLSHGELEVLVSMRDADPLRTV